MATSPRYCHPHDYCRSQTRRSATYATFWHPHVGIASWAERLGDPMLAAAALDRLLHRGVIVGIDGPSYRMRAHQQRADVIRKAATAAGTAR
jgi:hypothetical protein